MSFVKQYIIKYQTLSIPLKASIWFMISSVIQKAISLLTTPIFTRLLSTTDYGTINIFQSWINIIIIFTSLNLFYGCFNTGMTKFSEDRDLFTSSLQGLVFVFTTFWFIIYLVFRNELNNFLQMPTIFVLLMFVELYFSPAIYFWTARQRYDFKFQKVVFITLLMVIFNPVLGIIAVNISEDKALARIISIVLVDFIIGSCLWFVIFKKGKKLFNWKFWKYAFTFNVVLIPHYLSGMIMNQSDRLMINAMSGAAQAGIYSVAYSAGMTMILIINAVQNAYIPWLYRKLKDHDYDSIQKNTSYIIAGLEVCILLLVLVAPEVVNLLATSAYADAKWVIAPVAVSTFFVFLYNIIANIEFYFEKTKISTILSCISAIANIGLNYLFIPIFGYIIAGYTTLVSYMMYAFFHYLYMRYLCKEKIGGNKLFNERLLIFSSCILLLFSGIILLLYNYPIIRFSIFGIIVCFTVVKKNTIMAYLKNLKTV